MPLANQIIVALDFDSAQKAINMATTLSNTGVKFKVGMELFYSEGPAIIEKLKKHGEIFLDLKLHDIPNTMASAAKTLTKRGVWMFNVHASAGLEALKKVVEAVQQTTTGENLPRPKIIGVTVLTSLKDFSHLGISDTVETSVLNLTRLSAQAGLDGIVCSAQDVPQIKKNLSQINPSFLYVTPGIRLPENNSDDQMRITTPKQALQNGATHLVIGRPITKAENPLKALQEILKA